MGQERPQSILTRASRSSDRADDSLQESSVQTTEYATSILAGPAMPGLAVAAGAGPLLRELSGAADPLGGGPIPDTVLSALRRRKGGGQPLTPGMATEIGQQLGPAASAARIHTDGEADHLARSVQSVAFSYGSDVYFTQGSYAPHSPAGQRLLAHELSHVRQSATGGSAGGPIVGSANDPAEHEADRSADQVLGALRRQAARRATPVCEHAGQAQGGDLDAARSQAVVSTLARTASDVVRRVYTELERPGLLQLPQLENSQERVAALEAHNWSSADTLLLAQQQPAPTYPELNAIMARLTAAQLADIQPSCASLAEVVALAATAWPAADLARHAAFDPRPTAAELQAVIAFFSPEQVDAVMEVSSNWADIVQLAGTGWTADDLERVAGNGSPTVDQFKMIVSRFTAEQFDALTEPEAFSWENLAELAEAAEPAVQSPALTLKDALVACNSLIAEDVRALSEIGLAVAPRRYQALVVGTDSLADTDYHQVMDYLKDARWFSICFDTAQRLFEDLGNVRANSSGGARDAKYPQAVQRSRAHLLETHMNSASAAGTPTIFNIHVGGHGFSLTVIGAKVHQMEAFASQADGDADVLANFEDLSASLVTSIRSNNTYGIAEVTAAIVDMASTSRKKRTAAAAVMGWNPGPCGFLDDDGNITDPMAIWWESASLHSNAQIVTNIALRIQRQREQIRKTFGITDDAEDD
jgi:hypothetical protein